MPFTKPALLEQPIYSAWEASACFRVLKTYLPLPNPLETLTVGARPEYHTSQAVNEDELQRPEASGLDSCQRFVSHSYAYSPLLHILMSSLVADDLLDDSLVETRSAGHMGRGIFATKDVPAGTQILSETPLILVDGSMAQPTWPGFIAAFCETAWKASRNTIAHLETLGSEEWIEHHAPTIKVVQSWFKQQNIKAADQVVDHYVAKYTRLFSIYMRHGVILDPGITLGLFYQHSLINHSCSPNAHAYYDHTRQRHQVHVTRSLKAGDQIFISYNTRQTLTRAERHAEIRGLGHKFICDCTLCTSPEADAIMQRASVSHLSLSNYLTRIGVLHSEVSPSLPMPKDDTQALAIAEELVGLLRHPSIGLEGADLKSTLRNCSLFHRRSGNIQAAAAYARQELAVQVRVWGFGGDNFLGRYDAAAWLHVLERELSQMESGSL